VACAEIITLCLRMEHRLCLDARSRSRVPSQVIITAMTCSLCGVRRARRSCPALGHQICPVCCGTKRQVEISCPSDCVYLAGATEHPPAAIVRQRQHDLTILVQVLRDLNERQTELFTGVAALLQQYEAPDVHPLIDADVIEAAASLAATFETSARGVIYEHRPSSLPADRLANALKPVILEVERSGGTAFERDAAVVMRRLEQAATSVAGTAGSNRRSFIDLLNRVLKKQAPSANSSDRPEQRLIVP
jgi:hypothetical protein